MSHITDERFKHVHTDPRFARTRKQANTQSTETQDERFTAALNDPAFQTRAPKVDQYGRPLNQPKQAKKQENKHSKKPAKPPVKPVEDESEEEEIARELDDSEEEDMGSGNESDYGKSYLSTRELAPPSSDEDDEEEEEEYDINDPHAMLKRMYEGVQTPLADTSDEDEDEEIDDIEEQEEEEPAEEIPHGDPTRRIAIMNLDWDRLRSIDLYVLIRSFLTSFKTENGDSNVEHLKSVKIYPSEFGKERIAEEAKYGPIGLYSGDAEKYRQALQAKIDSVPVKARSDDNEQSDDDSEQSENESDDESSAQQQKDESENEQEDAEDDKQHEDEESDDDMEDSSASNTRTIVPNDDEQLLDNEKLRQYELSRLKYYYAIAEFASVQAASYIYSEIDGVEFESSANKLDLRFVPDDVSFDGDEPRDICDGLTTNELAAYQAPVFTTRALQNSRVELTWDGDDPERKKKMQAKKGTVEDDDLAVYLASDNEDGYGSDALTDVGEMDSDDGQPVRLKRKARSKYKSLLQELAADEDEEGGEPAAEEEEGFSITFEPGLKAKGEEIAAKALEKEKAANETVFEQQLRKQREKRKLKKKQTAAAAGEASQSDDEAAERDEEKFDDDLVDVDMNDPFFRDAFDEEEFGVSAEDKNKQKAREFFSEDARPSKHQRDKQEKADKKKGKGKDKSGPAEELDPSLALLVEEDDGKGYDLKALIREHKQANKTGKKNKSKNAATAAASKGDEFHVDVADPRFSVLYENPVYSIDPTHPQYKPTKGMDELQQERQRRRLKSDREVEASVKAKKAALCGEGASRAAPELSSLVQSVKAKANALGQAKKARENAPHKRPRGDRDTSMPSLQTTTKRARQS